MNYKFIPFFSPWLLKSPDTDAHRVGLEAPFWYRLPMVVVPKDVPMPAGNRNPNRKPAASRNAGPPT